MIRNCTVCLPERQRPAAFCGADATGLEWYDCGTHGVHETLSDEPRVRLTPLRDWFLDRGFRVVGPLEDLEVLMPARDCKTRDQWVASDGTRWWFCSGRYCPGVRGDYPPIASCQHGTGNYLPPERLVGPDLEIARPNEFGGWVGLSGKIYWFCSGSSCPGLPWRASERPHPPTCSIRGKDCSLG